MPFGRLGKYELLEVLGHGSSGIVWCAKDTLLKKDVALKVIERQNTDAERLLQEARILDRLVHPHIVTIYGADLIDGKVVIAMEYVRGQSLHQLLNERRRIPPGQALAIVAQVLDGLAYSHANKIVHRDLKPANVLLTRDGSAKLADFGTAETLVSNAYLMGGGTYAYMAPECFAENPQSDSRSDLWSVGVMLYEMLCGKRPFQVQGDSSVLAWKRAVETEAPVLNVACSELPPPMQAVIRRALARDKSRRYQTAEEFLADVTATEVSTAVPQQNLSPAPKKGAWVDPRSAEGVIIISLATCLVVTLLCVACICFLALHFSSHRASASPGRAAVKADSPAKIVQVYRPALHHNPGDAVAHQKRGDTFLRRRDYADAEREYRQALQIDPRGSYLPEHLGDIYLHERLWTQAAQAYKQAVQRDPGDIVAHNSLGDIYLHERRFNEAVQEYSQVLQIDPKDRQARRNLRHALRRWGSR